MRKFITLLAGPFARLLTLVLMLALPFSALASEWDWTSDPTPGAQNVFASDTEEDQEPEENFENGDLSDDIILSEVMPNPEGTDTDTEWIEIYNTGTNDVDLGNWQLDDADGGSDPYVFPANTVIEAQDFLVIYRSASDIALNNDTDDVRLFNYEGSLQDNVTYESSPEGQSYARIVLESNAGTISSASLFAWLVPTAQAAEWQEAPWEWTEEVTTGYLNPIYYFIQGEIQEITPFEDKVTLEDNGTSMNVSLASLDLNEELKKSVFTPGNTISGYATLSNNLFELQRFEDTQTAISPSQDSSKKTNLFLLLALFICGLGFFYLKSKKARQGHQPRLGLS